MFKKFLKSKNKNTEIKEKTEKPSKKVLKEIKNKDQEPKEKVITQPPTNKMLTAEGWQRRQKKSS